MLLNRVAVLNLLEAAEVVGIRREALTSPFADDLPALLSGAERMEWGAFAQLLEHLDRLVGGDPERLREIGRRMTHVPSYAIVGRVVQGVVSVPMLYRAADRWLGSANFPFLRIFMRFVSDDRLQMHLEIPAAYAPSAPFFWIALGAVETLPEILGLPPTVPLETRITPTTADFDLRLPAMPARTRLRGATRALFGARAARDVLAEQRRELSTNIEALARARAELRDMLDRLPNLVLVHVGGTIVWVNRPCLAALGYDDASEIIRTSLLDRAAPRSRAQLREQLEHSPSEASSALSEIVLLGRTGKEVIVEMAPAQAVVFEDRPARLVVARDVTDRVMMQQRLLVADRMAAVGLLAAGVAHEVNNPLAYILNNIEIAKRTLAGIGPAAEVARESLSIALEGVDRIRTVVHDLLMLARGEDRGVGVVDVRPIAESTIALARPEIDVVAELVVDFRPAPLVHATEARLAQILLNLIGNALEAMRGLRREDCRLVVRVAPAGDGRLLLEVSDSGRGIAPSDLGRVFEPFFTTKPAGEGTGLGLPIVQRLVSELGGEISVTSTPGQGASFRVLLPAASTGSRPPVPSPSIGWAGSDSVHGC